MRRLRHLLIGLVVCAGVSIGAAAGAQAPADSSDAPVVVIEVGDPLDQRMIDFIEGTIQSTRAHLFVLKIDSPGVSSGDLSSLFETVSTASAPVVSWIGPAPAVAFGGSAYLANHADIRSGAPGAVVGYLDPAVQRGGSEPPSIDRRGVDPAALAVTIDALEHDTVIVRDRDVPVTVPGFVDRLDPALGQLLVAVDGAEIVRPETGQSFVVSTSDVVDVGGTPTIVVSRRVQFVKPGLLDRFLRLGARPETAFLFLVFGLAFAVFEFYAAGTGLMAAVASLSLIVAGYGVATLPMWWPAMVLVVGGIGMEVWGFVHNRLDWRAAIGGVMVLVGGVTFTTSRPAFPPVVWMVVLATAAASVFIWYALTTVVRGRFATPTVGRDELVGRRCLVVDTLDPVGVVVLDGARWRAITDRGVEITAGAAAEVVAVTGLLLEVDPVGPRSYGENP